jgi:hypothetical protein
MRGEKEQQCLKIVREKYSVESCYALSQEEYDNIENYLSVATPNPKDSEFPDFVFTDGFIEHFQVSSSKKNRNGAKHLKDESMFIKEFEQKEAELRESIVNTPNEIKAINSCFNFPEHSYENLVKSFKTTWSKHVESLEKMLQYKGSCGIFMIEYSDKALEMLEDIFQNSKQDLFLHIREPQRFDDYKLSRDKELLRYIAKYKDVIQFVIYVNTREVEVISTRNIKEVIKLLPWDFRIASFGYQVKRRGLYGISIPNELNKGADDE